MKTIQPPKFEALQSIEIADLPVRPDHRSALSRAFCLFFFLSSIAIANAQTITWTAASNPHVVSGTYTIPAGQTLVMEAGVIVNMQANSTLQVDGQLIGNGTAANHVKITGGPSAQTTMDVRGTSDLKFTEIRTLIAPDSNGVLLFADCSFPSDAAGGGYVFNGSVLQADGSRASYLQFDRCTFQGGASLYLVYANVVLRNTTFAGGSFCSVYPGYLFVDGVSSDHSAFFGLAFGSDSDLFLNNINVTNAANEGLKLAGDTRNGTNVLLGPNVTLQANEYPVNLTIAGLYAASNIPATGNRNNLIHVSEFAGVGGHWPKFAIPYYSDGSPLNVSSGLYISPGVTVKMAPFSYIIDTGFGDGMRAFGTKNAPITFERADPAQAWYDLHADRTEGGRMRHTIVTGNTDGVNGGRWRLENCVFQNNGIGTNGGALVSGSQYLNNTIGAYGTDNLNDAANPNSFVGNGTGLYYSPDARNCWWNSPSGPTTPSNPGGTGDSIGTQQTVFTPFRTSAPSYADAPPEVVLMRPAFQQDPGSKVTLRWTSTDDVGIASHKILFSPVGNWPGSFQTVATLPGNQFTYEWTVPNVGNTINGDDAFIKVVAVDTTGKESFDEAEIIIPTNAIAGEVQFNVTPGQTFGPGEMLASVYTTTGIDPYVAEVEYYFEDVRGETRKLTGRGRGGLPFLSTDTMRFVVAFGTTTNNRKYWFSPFFKMRPDSHLNDAPATVSLTFPQAGNSFAPGSVIPISWTASDDEGLRGFDILASYNAGRTWQPIAQNLPGTARSFNWQTAPGTGYGDVRMMVIAKDWRFQTSSDGAARSFAIVGGAPTPSPTPTATATPTPGVTPIVTPTPIATATPAATPTATPTPTPAGSPTPAATPTPSPNPASNAINLSTRVRVQSGENAGIGGFIITGTAPKHVLIRAIGPSLTGFGVPNALANPALELHGPGTFVTMVNDNWKDTQAVEIQATGIAPSHDLEAAIDATLDPGAYTAVARGSNNTAGIALIEVYDLSQAVPAKLANISTRAFVSSGDDIVIAGFMLGNHNGNDRIVVRGIGPSLAAFGVSAALANPTLELRDNNGALLVANNDWQDDPAQAAELTAAGLAPTNNLESGIAATLPPGSYTALLAGVNNGAGIGVVEVYDRGMP